MTVAPHRLISCTHSLILIPDLNTSILIFLNVFLAASRSILCNRSAANHASGGKPERKLLAAFKGGKELSGHHRIGPSSLFSV